MSKAMSDKRLLTILLGALLGICMVLSIGIQNVYAEGYDDEDLTEYTAEFSGDVSLIANEDGDLDLDLDKYQDGSVTIKTTDGDTIDCCFRYEYNNGDDAEDDDGYGWYYLYNEEDDDYYGYSFECC